MKSQVRITEAQTVLMIQSEPYVIFKRTGYTPVIDVDDFHKGVIGYLVISAISLGEQLHEIQLDNSGKLSGMTITIRKEDGSRFARYIVERLE